MPPENIKKTEGFFMFSGVQEETNDMKLVKKEQIIFPCDHE